MPDFDQKKIDLGRQIHNLTEYPNFDPFVKELRERRDDMMNLALSVRTYTADGQISALTYTAKYQALQDILDWMQETIDDGAKELLKKQKEDE